MFTISCSLFLYRNAQSNFYLFNQVTVHYSEEFLWGFSNKSEITLFVSVQHSRDDWFPNPNWRDAKKILSNILLHQLSYFVNYRCIQCSMLYDLFLFWIYKGGSISDFYDNKTVLLSCDRGSRYSRSQVMTRWIKALFKGRARSDIAKQIHEIPTHRLTLWTVVVPFRKWFSFKTSVT